MKNILITGSNGFIGSYFIKKYMQTYNLKVFSFLHEKIENLECSDCDVVLHLSGLVHQMAGASEEEYIKINLKQTLAIANKAKKSGVKQFIFMSTVKVYGEETDLPYTENSVCNPKDAYGRSKLKAEQELLKLQSNSFKISIIRTPIVYGYGVKANIKKLINLVDKISLLPFGSISNQRSFVYVGNLSHLCDLIIKQEISGIFLASDDQPISTSQLCTLIADKLHKKIYLIKIPFFEILLSKIKPSLYKRLYKNLIIDNSLTKKKLNLINPYSIDKGIELMIDGECF